MSNTVMINSAGYIEFTLVGHQTQATFADLYEDALPLIAAVQRKEWPLRGLFNLTNETGFSLNSDRAAMELLEKVDYDRVAMYHVPHAEVTKGIILAIGKSDNTKLFDSREAAVAWLIRE